MQRLKAFLVVIASMLSATLAPFAAQGQITNWQTGQTIPDTEGIVLGPKLSLQGWQYASHNLNYADFSGGLDLSGSVFHDDWLGQADFSQADLSGTSFVSSFIDGANLTDAIIKGATFTQASNLTATQIYSTASYKNKNLAGVTLYFADLTGWSFANQNLTGGTIGLSKVDGIDWSGATLAGVNFVSSTFSGGSLTALNLSGAGFSGCTLTNTDLSNANLSGALSKSSTFDGVNFSHANFTNASFSYMNATTFKDSDFAQADLTGANFYFINWTGNNNFSDAVIARAAFGDSPSFTANMLYTTASYHNKNLQGIDLDLDNGSGWNLSEQDLTGARLDRGTYTTTDFSGANLSNAFAYQGKFVGADFRDADLAGANFGAADLTNVDLTNANITGSDFSQSKGFTAAGLYSTASYQSRLIAGARFLSLNMSGFNFANQSLPGTSFDSAVLVNADFSLANVSSTSFASALLTGAVFTGATVSSTNFNGAKGFTAPQLYSTASYKNKVLTGINLQNENLTDWNFAGQNLTGTQLSGANLTRANLSQANLTSAVVGSAGRISGSNLSEADLRGATGFVSGNGTIIHNTIMPDGSISNLSLANGEVLPIHNVPVPIAITGSMKMVAGAALQAIFDGPAWNSTVSLDPNVAIQLAGTLRLDISPEVDAASLVGDTFQLFNWNGAAAAGQHFDMISAAPNLVWDTSLLYSNGIVSLVAAFMPGDFDHNGVIDAADYVVWRRGVETAFSQSDYGAWRAHYGQLPGSGSAGTSIAAVPEPALLTLFAVCLSAVCFTRRF